MKTLSRRRFIELSSMFTLGGVATQWVAVPIPVSGQETTGVAGQNWARNYSYRAMRLRRPKSVEQLQQVAAEASQLSALGSRHSFNNIADTPGDLVSMEHFGGVIAMDRDDQTVTVGGGARYGDFAVDLHRRGFAVHNLASLPHTSVAGACATATHGSGDKNGNLATSVSGIEMVTADGKVVTLSRGQNGDAFNGAAVSLGGLGLVTKVTLGIIPTFDVRQFVYEGLSQRQLEDNFDDIFGRAYSVSVFTPWNDDSKNALWLKCRVGAGDTQNPPAKLFGAKASTEDCHPILALSAESCTLQLGVAGPWYERLPHFKMGFRPSTGAELQSEYFVPRQHAAAALRVVHGLRKRLAPVLQISEIRTIAADNLWMSPCFGQACVSFHFTWKKDWPGVRAVLPLLEQTLAPFNVRPHWGKLFTMAPDVLQSRCPKLKSFRELVRTYDPDGKFRNDFLNRYIFGNA